MFYKDLEKRRRNVREFIRKNPNATCRDLRKIKIKIEKTYSKGIKEAFIDAGIKPPRTFKRKTVEEKRKIIINYIKKHPKAGGQKISKDTKIRFLSIFKNTKEVFDEAGVDYPRKLDRRKKKGKKKEIINLIRKNPLITMEEIGKKLHLKPYNFFKSINEIYNLAGIKPLSGVKKRKIKKWKKITQFIKNNQTATQREINKICRTHVQEMFKGGIFEAYKQAGINFPFERLKIYGVARKDIKERSKKYEKEVAIKLSKYGKVNRLVKTKRGVIDIVFERKNKKAIIEVKDYRAKDISISQIKQLNKYLDDYDCNFGILICHKKPKKEEFIIKNNKIYILDNSNIDQVPKLVEKYGQDL
jgi:hypothetical protein